MKVSRQTRRRRAREESRLRSRIPKGYEHLAWEFDETPFGSILSASAPDVGLHVIGSPAAMAYAAEVWNELCLDTFGAPSGPPILHGPF